MSTGRSRSSSVAPHPVHGREVRIRVFRRSDLRFLEGGLQADQREVAPFDPLRMILPLRGWGRTYARHLVQEVRSRGGRILIAEAGRTRAGFVVGVLQPSARAGDRAFAAARPAWIYDLYVVPRFRRIGVATRLMVAVEAYFTAEGRDFVHLLALTGNDSALALYRTRGYVQRVFLLGKRLEPRS